MSCVSAKLANNLTQVYEALTVGHPHGTAERSHVGCSRTGRQLPICILVTTLSPQHPTSTTHAHGRRLDPVMFIAALVLATVVGWSCLPLAIGAGPAPVNSGARVDLEVPVTTSVTPG